MPAVDTESSFVKRLTSTVNGISQNGPIAVLVTTVQGHARPDTLPDRSIVAIPLRHRVLLGSGPRSCAVVVIGPFCPPREVYLDDSKRWQRLTVGENGVVARSICPSHDRSVALGNSDSLVAWLMARTAAGEFIVRMEDLDRVTASAQHETGQLGALRSIGLDWDGEVLRQSDRFALYREAIDRLVDQGLVYECYCSRREIRLAAEASARPRPRRPRPGTVRSLTNASAWTSRRGADGRHSGLLSGDRDESSTTDLWTGNCRVDDFVLHTQRRSPGVQPGRRDRRCRAGVTEGGPWRDLVHPHRARSCCTDARSADPALAHIPLVLARTGQRLAKRHGAVTLADLAPRRLARGDGCARLAETIGIDTNGHAVMAGELLDRFDPDRMPRAPWILTPEQL